MKEVKKLTENSNRIIIQKNRVCNFGTVRYMYDDAGPHGYTLHSNFKNSVNRLPQRYRKHDYMQFIENWGTVRT